MFLTNLVRMTFGLLNSLAVPMLVGCATAPVDSDVSLRLSLRARTTDRRSSYFELSGDGQLAFAGGRHAMIGSARPVTTLTVDQLQQVRDIVAHHRLFEARRHPTGQPKRVTYELALRTKGHRRRIRCVDDDVPGVESLHQLLFQIQADARYRSELIVGVKLRDSRPPERRQK